MRVPDVTTNAASMMCGRLEERAWSRHINQILEQSIGEPHKDQKMEPFAVVSSFRGAASLV